MGAALNDLAYAVNDTIKDPEKFKALNVLIQEMINASVIQTLNALNNTFGTENALPLNVLLSNAIANHGVKEFTSSGVFTVPEGIYKIFVTACGGGGGGGGADSKDDDYAGCGGNGGSCIIREPFSVQPGEQISITIGAAGAAGTNSASPTAGSAGGATVIGNLVTLPGGSAGNSYRQANKKERNVGAGVGGNGSYYSSSSNNAVAEDGTDGVRSPGGCGGGYREGGGGGGSYGVGGSGATASLAATNPGPGGGGGGGAAETASTKASAGGKGYCLIEW